MRRIIVFIASLGLCFALSAEKTRVGILNGPSCVPGVQMMSKTSTYEFSQYADPQALLPKILKKEVDVGFFPVNVAAKVYNSASKAVVMLAVTGNGNVRLITTDPSIKQFSDLQGKTLTVAGQGAVPDYMTRYLLAENQISVDTKDGVELSFSIPTAQIAAQLISGKIDYAVVPEPFATVALMKGQNVRSAIDYTDEYKFLNGDNAEYPLTVLVARSDFAQQNPQAIAAFLKDYEKSLNWTLKHPSQAGKLCEKNNLGLAADVLTKAIPVSNYVFVPAAEARKNVEEFLGILMEFSPESVGGSLPESDFYYAEQSPSDRQ